MHDLSIPPDFNWKTVRPVEVYITGSQNPDHRFNTLAISSVNGGAYYKKKYADGENLHISLEVPTGIDKLFIDYDGVHGEMKIAHDIAAVKLDDLSPKQSSATDHDADSDQDGVYDVNDDYPFDKQRAYNISYYGDAPVSLAFEDNWPSLGDFDFNDLVVDVSMHFVTNARDQIVALTARIKVRAIGAKFINGFGFRLRGITPQAILSVSGNRLSEGIVQLNANGTEAGQGEATIIAFDNPFPILPPPGGGTGVNTTKSAAFVDPVEIEVQVLFQDEGILGGGVPLYYGKFIRQHQAINPFIFINGQRGREVHLPGYPPTDLANTGRFGSVDDASDPASGKFYTSNENFPWAILIPQSFDYPVEKSQITAAHLKFGLWAQSSGMLYRNWYKNLPGYRRDALIY